MTPPAPAGDTAPPTQPEGKPVNAVQPTAALTERLNARHRGTKHSEHDTEQRGGADERQRPVLGFF